MKDKNRTKTQRRRKGAKPPRQITELHTSKAGRTGAEEAVRESEYWKRAIIDSIPSVAWLKDKEYRFVAVNERLCEALGMRAENLTGKTDFDVWPRDLAEQFRADDEEVMKTGKPERAEEQWDLAGGDRIWIETIRTPIFDEKGEVIATSGIAHDITERRKSQDRLSAIVYKSPIPTAVGGADGSIITFNEALENMIGYKASEISDVSDWARKLYPNKEYREFVWKNINQALDGRKQDCTQFTITCKDGSTRIVDFYTSFFEDGLVIQMVDITQRKWAEEALRESEERYRSQFEQALDAIFVADAETGILTDCNRAASELVGRDKSELIGQHQRILHPPEEIEGQFSRTFKKHLQEKEGRVLEAQVITKEGQIKDVMIMANLLEVGSKKALRGTFHDITERKQAEKRRQRLTEVLREKNRELEEIIRVATHDMRTPMVNIEGFGRILASSCEQIQSLIEGQKIPNKLTKQLDEVIGEDIPEAVGIMNLGVSKMNSLLDGLLRLAKLGYLATEIIKLDMNTKIESILDTMKFQVEQSGAEIKVESLPSCLGDKAQINQVFSNLLGNALKYLDPSRPGSVRISGQVQQNYSVYCVQDNGIGIEADNIEDIFRMFYCVRPADDAGEGLGLAIVRRIVNRHNGEVWAESEVGKGSKFFVKLPRR